MIRQLLTQLTKESFVYGLAAAASKLVGLILVPLYTKQLAQTDYALLGLLTTTAGVFGSLLILGLDTGATLNFYKTEDPQQRRIIVSTFLGFELALTALVSAILFALAEPIASVFFGSASYTTFVQLVLATVPFSTATTLLLDAARLWRLPWRYTLISVGTLLLAAALIIVLVLVFQLELTGVLIGSLVGNLIFTFVGWRLLAAQYTRAFSWPILRQMLVIGLPLVPAILANWVISFSNRWFLWPVSTSSVAILTFATQLNAPVLLLVTAFQIAWVPFSLSIARNSAAPAVYARTLLYFLALSYTILLALALVAPPLITIFATPAYLPAVSILALVGFSSIIYGVYYIVGTGVSLAGQTMHLGWTAVVGAIISIAANILLIPQLGIVGAASAALLANLVPVALLYRVAQRIHPLPYDLPRIIVLSVVGALALALATWLPSQTLALDVVSRSALLLVFVVLLAPLGVLRSQELRGVGAMLNRVRGRAS